MSMRVLCVKVDGSLNAFEVVDVWYSNKIVGITKRYDEKVEGIVMTAASNVGTNYHVYIENISMQKCNEICESLYRSGVADLREYGSYQVCKF